MPIHNHSTANNKWNLVSVDEHLGKLKYSFSKHRFAYNSEILLLGICLRKMKTHINTKTGAWMAIETLFIMVKKWKQIAYQLIRE